MTDKTELSKEEAELLKFKANVDPRTASED